MEGGDSDGLHPPPATLPHPTPAKESSPLPYPIYLLPLPNPSPEHHYRPLLPPLSSSARSSDNCNLTVPTNIPHSAHGVPLNTTPLRPDGAFTYSSNGYSQDNLIPPFLPIQYDASCSAQDTKQTKGKRVAVACRHCRSRKQKCDGRKPCQYCQQNDFDCQYRDEINLPRKEQVIVQIQESVDCLSNMFKTFANNLNMWKASVEARLPVTKLPEFMATATDHPEGVFSVRGPTSEYLTPLKSIDLPWGFGNASQDPGALQSDHDTPAHKLLPELTSAFKLEEKVPALIHLINRGKCVIDYPMFYEMERGTLRAWGVGEGHDGDILRHQESVGPDSGGKPDFRLSTLQSLCQSYQEHIYVLHPVLDLGQLKNMIDDFGKTYSPEARASYAMFPAAIPERLNPGLKRKCSSSMFNDKYLSEGSVEKSLRNAIVLLVLALGKVSEHKANLPSPQANRDLASNGTYDPSQELPSYSEKANRSEVYNTHPRNIDILPSMVYYSTRHNIISSYAKAVDKYLEGLATS